MSKAIQSGQLYPLVIETAVCDALLEDLGHVGDLTTEAIVSRKFQAQAEIRARQTGRIAGLQLANEAFRRLDPNLSFLVECSDGDSVEPGDTVARIKGSARAILSGERTALNFLMHLSGIATYTHKFVTAIEGTPAHICCTRKTAPGLRALEKYAVRMGGGMNHRFGLSDAILIKDNHIAIAGGVAPAIDAVQRHAGHMVKIEVEVESIEQLKAVINSRIDAVLLDNMTVPQLRKAVKLVSGRLITEASGGVNLETVRRIAETGVDLISVGSITHSAAALDLGLDMT